MKKEATKKFIVRHASKIYFFGLASALYYLFNLWLYDDPFITFRYAQNIATGNGFVYNPGMPVLSTTTPLYALFLSILAGFGLPLESMATLTSALACAAGGLLIYEIGQKLGKTERDKQLIGLAGLLFYPTFPLIVQTFSSETPIYIALCLGTILAYLGNRQALTGLLMGAAVLTRADALVLGGVLGLDWLLFRRKEMPGLPWKTIGTFAAVLLPWAIYGSIVFGSPVPETLAVKQAQARLAGSESFAVGLLAYARGYAAASPHFVALAALFLVGTASSFKQPSGRLIFVLWPLLYTAAYIFLGVTRYFWYFAPIIPGMVVCAGFGLERTAQAFNRERLRSFPHLFTLFILLLFTRQSIELVNLRQYLDNRIVIYRAAGEWFAANTAEDASIGSLEVGAIGYYARPRPMIDFAGLIEPEVAGQFTDGYSYGQAAIWAADRYRPDYLVLIEGHFNVLLATYRGGSCNRVTTLQGEAYGFDGNLLIFDCRSAP